MTREDIITISHNCYKHKKASKMPVAIFVLTHSQAVRKATK